MKLRVLNKILKNLNLTTFIWKPLGVIPIISQEDYPSSNSNRSLFISNFLLIKYGGCSLMVERSVVVRTVRVRFSASTLRRIK